MAATNGSNDDGDDDDDDKRASSFSLPKQLTCDMQICAVGFMTICCIVATQANVFGYGSGTQYVRA